MEIPAWIVAILAVFGPIAILGYIMDLREKVKKLEAYKATHEQQARDSPRGKDRSQGSGNFLPSDQNAMDELAEHVAMAVLELEDIAHVIQSEHAMRGLLNVRKELIKLVKDLGGHPAIR